MPHVRSMVLLAGVAALAACGEDTLATRVQPPQEMRTEGYLTPGRTQEGYVVGRDGQPRRITFEVQGELAVVEGDIVIGRAAEIPRTPEELTRRRAEGVRFGVIIDGQQYRWPGGVVPYVFARNLANKDQVNAAIAHIEANTSGVDFVPRTNQANYIYIYSGNGCSSWVGVQGGRQDVNIGRWCGFGAAVHELSHALGMHHEQSRCDRDAYVEILWQNIQPGMEYNFETQCDGYTDYFAYAEGSIMHYGPTGFSKNGQPTIRSRRGLDHLMGQRNGLGTTDVQQHQPDVSVT